MLARWSGWGAVPQVFDEHLDRFAEARGELRELVSEAEFAAARRTILNAHYTDAALVTAIWDGLRGLGFTGGHVLEPGCGSGHFIGLAPGDARMTGVELDSNTAAIAAALYPHAQIVSGSFADLDAAEGSFDAAVGNVPFAKVALSDPRHNPGQHSLHNHFIIKALHLVRPGGLVAVLTSRYTLDAQNPAARREMTQLADLVGAVRLPTGAHRRAAGTDVVTDLLILRRHVPGEPPADGGWELASPRPVPDRDGSEVDVNINQYFHDHPDHVLGELLVSHGQYGDNDLRVVGERDAAPALTRMLGEIVASATKRGQTMTAASPAQAARPAVAVALIDKDAARFEGYLDAVPDGTFTRRVGGKPAPYEPPAAQAEELRQLLALRDLAMGLIRAEGRSIDDTDDIRDLRGQLNRTYDRYVAAFGAVNRSTQRQQKRQAWHVFGDWCRDHDLTKLPAAAHTVREYLADLRDCGLDQATLTQHLDGVVKAHQTACTIEITKVVARLREQRFPDNEIAAAEHLAATHFAHFAATYQVRNVALDSDAVAAGQVVIATAPQQMNPDLDLDEAGLQTTITIRPPQGGFRDDPFAGAVRALERFDPVTQTARKHHIFIRRVVNPIPPRLGAETAEEALSICLDTHSRVDLAEIAHLMGLPDPAAARDALGGLVFNDPRGATDPAAANILWPRHQYLAGDVRLKLKQAAAAANLDSRFAANVEALQQVIPPDLGPADIEVRLGSWIGPDYVQQFLRELLQDSSVRVQRPAPGLWHISGGNGGVQANKVWGAGGKSAYELAEMLLLGRAIKVYRKVDGPDGKEKQVLDPEATEAAQDKAREIGDRFSDWVWRDVDRAQELIRYYNDHFNNTVAPNYAGMDLSLPGYSGFPLRDHQRAAIGRMIFEPSVGLVHDVGAGKTLEIIVGVMERRRRGLSTKPVVVVRNDALVDQFEREWRQAYPNARLLTGTSADLADQKKGRNKRAEFVALTATNDYDAIIITKEAFESIPLKPEAQERFLNRELDNLRAIQAEAVENRLLDESLAKKFENALASLEARVQRRLDGIDRDSGVCFEETGIDYVVVDEAQDFRNGMLGTNLEGLAIPGSNRAIDLDMKLDQLTEVHGGPRCCLATATPFTNRLTEIYLFLRRLGADLLPFDEWARSYVILDYFMEMTAGGQLKQVPRMRATINEPELWHAIRLHGDVKMQAELGLKIPASRGGQIEILANPANWEQRIFTADLAIREATGAKEGRDHHFAIMHQGILAALDARTVDLDTDDPQKVDLVADDIMLESALAATNVYRREDGSEHPVRGGLIVVFCDEGVPGGKQWNFYAELRAQLVARGMPEDRVRFIHDATHPRKRAELYEACREGAVSVLVGSTKKMGAGLNIQTRLIGGYELTSDWNPDVTLQAQGRVFRQGNQNPEAFWKRVVTSPSMDAKKWAIVTQKATMFLPLLASTPPNRSREIKDNITIGLADVIAAATGDPRHVEKAELDHEHQRLRRLRQAYLRNQQDLQFTVSNNQRRVPDLQTRLAQQTGAAQRRVDTRGAAFRMVINGTAYTKRPEAADALGLLLLGAMAEAPKTLDGATMTVGELGGFTVIAQLRPLREKTITLSFAEAPASNAEVFLNHRNLPSKHGIITQLENQLDQLDTAPEVTRALIARAERDIAEAQAEVGVAFLHADELARVEKRRQQVINELTAHLQVDGDQDTELAAARAAARAEVTETARARADRDGWRDGEHFAHWYTLCFAELPPDQRPPLERAYPVWWQIRGHREARQRQHPAAGRATPAAVPDHAEAADTVVEQSPATGPPAEAGAPASLAGGRRWNTTVAAAVRQLTELPNPYPDGSGHAEVWQQDRDELAAELRDARRTQLSPTGALIAYKVRSETLKRQSWFVVHAASGTQLGCMITKPDALDTPILRRDGSTKAEIDLPDKAIGAYLIALEHPVAPGAPTIDWSQDFAAVRAALGEADTGPFPVDAFTVLPRRAESPAGLALLRVHCAAVLDAVDADPAAAALHHEFTRVRVYLRPERDDRLGERSAAPMLMAFIHALGAVYPKTYGDKLDRTQRATDEPTDRALRVALLRLVTGSPAAAVSVLAERADAIRAATSAPAPTLPAETLDAMVAVVAELCTPAPTELERLLGADAGWRVVGSPPDSLAPQPEWTWSITGSPQPVHSVNPSRKVRLPVTLHTDNGLLHGEMTVDPDSTSAAVQVRYDSDQPDYRGGRSPTGHRLPAVAAGSWLVVAPDETPPFNRDELLDQSRRAARLLTTSPAAVVTDTAAREDADPEPAAPGPAAVTPDADALSAVSAVDTPQPRPLESGPRVTGQPDPAAESPPAVSYVDSMAIGSADPEPLSWADRLGFGGRVRQLAERPLAAAPVSRGWDGVGAIVEHLTTMACPHPDPDSTEARLWEEGRAALLAAQDGRRGEMSPGGTLLAFKHRDPNTRKLGWYVVHAATGHPILTDRGAAQPPRTPTPGRAHHRPAWVDLPDRLIYPYLDALERLVDPRGHHIDWMLDFAALQESVRRWQDLEPDGALPEPGTLGRASGMIGLHIAAILHAAATDPERAAEHTALVDAIVDIAGDRRERWDVRHAGALIQQFGAVRHAFGSSGDEPRHHEARHRTRAIRMDRITRGRVVLAQVHAFGADPHQAVSDLEARAEAISWEDGNRPVRYHSNQLRALALAVAELFSPAPTELERLLAVRVGDHIMSTGPTGSPTAGETWVVTAVRPDDYRLSVDLLDPGGPVHGSLDVDLSDADRPIRIHYDYSQPDNATDTVHHDVHLPGVAAGSWALVPAGQPLPTTAQDLERLTRRAVHAFHAANPDAPADDQVSAGAPITPAPTALAAITDAPAPENSGPPAELVDLGEFPGAWFSEDLGFAPTPLIDIDRAWIEWWLTRLAQSPETHHAARTHRLEEFFDEFRGLASAAMLAAGEDPDPAARPSKAVHDWYFGDQRSPAVLLVDAATQLHAAVHRGTDQPVAPTPPPATRPAAGPLARDSARNADDFGATPAGTEPPDPADIRAVARPEPAPSAPVSPQPGPWSTRIRVDLSPTGLVVSGTDRKRDPEILRTTLKDNNFWWRGKERVWRHQGRTKDRLAAAQAVRDLLSELDAQAAQEQAAPAYPPTAQQQAIIDAVVAGQDVAVLALAGTGKTSTLRMLARALSDRRIVYIAFNRTTADEAQRSFPPHVTADTMHAFARQGLRDGPHGRLLDKLNNGGARLSKDVAPALGIRRAVMVGGLAYEPETLARLAMDTVGQFRNSADDQLIAQHLPSGVADNPQLAQFVLDRAEQAWSDILSPAGKLVFTHDDYLKLWALTKPRLGADVIFFDEAQDINDVQRQVIVDQRTRSDGGRGSQIIVVGDSYQSIYGFRGAKDALHTWPADVRLPLTQSWRFGPAVAQLGNQFLALLNASMVLEGNPALRSRAEPVPRPDAILCRTNAGAVSAVFEAFDAGRRVALVGGGEAIEDIAKAAQALQRNRRTRHPDLAGFASWSDVREAANTEPAAKHLQPFVRLVDKHGAQRLIDMAHDLVAEDDPDPDKVIVSTAHKAKGLEWDRVLIADDFRGPTEDGENGVVLPGLEEIRLSYVAVTRAKASIELGSLSWIRDYAPGEHPAAPERSIVDAVVPPQQRDDTPTPILAPPAISAPAVAADAGEVAPVAAFGITDAHPAVAEVCAAVALLPASSDPARAALDRHRLAAAALGRYVTAPDAGGIQTELAAIADRYAHGAVLLPRSLELRPPVEWPHWVRALRQCATVLVVAGDLDDFTAAIGRAADLIEGRIAELAEQPAEVIADTGMAAIRLVPADHPAAPPLGRQLRRAQRDHRVTGEDHSTGLTLKWARELLEDARLVPDAVADQEIVVGSLHRRWGTVTELRALADHVEAAGYTTPLPGRAVSAPDLWRQLADATAARLDGVPNREDKVLHEVPDTVPDTPRALHAADTVGPVERLAAALADGSDSAGNATDADLAASSLQETPLRAFRGLRTAGSTWVAGAAAALEAGSRADALFHLTWALPDDPSFFARGSKEAWEILDLLLRNTGPTAVDLAELDRLSRYPITYFDDSPPLIAAHLVGLAGALLGYADHVNDDLGRVLATLPIHPYAAQLDSIAAQIAQRFHFPLPTDEARLRPDQVVEGLAAEAKQAADRAPARDAEQPDTASGPDPHTQHSTTPGADPTVGSAAPPPPRDPQTLFEHAVALARVAHAVTAAAGGHNPNAWLAFSEVVRTDPHTGIAYAAVQPQWEEVSQWWYDQASAALAELGYTVEARGRDDGRRGWRDHQIEVDTDARVVIVDARQVVGTTAHNLVACVAELRDAAAGDPVFAEQRQAAPVAGATAEHPENAGIVSGQANLFDQPAEVAAPATASGGVAAEDSNPDEAAELDEIYAAEGYPLIDDLTGVADLFAAHHWVLVDEQPNELGATQHWRRHDASLAVTVTPHDRVLTFIETLHGPMESDTWVEGEVASAADLRSLIEQDGLHGVARPARLPGLWRVTAAEDPDTAVAAAEPDPAARLVARPADAATGDSWTFVDDGTPVPLAPPLPHVPVTNRADLHRYVLGEHHGDRQLREMASIILGHRSRGGVTLAMACEQLANANPHVYHRAVAGSVGYVRGAPFDFDRARLTLERLAEGDPALPLNSLGQYVELTESVPAVGGNPTGDQATTQPVRGVVVDIRPDPIRVRVIIQRDEPSSAGAEQVAADFPIDGRVVVLDPATRPTAGVPARTAAAQSDRPALTTAPDTGEPEQLAHQEPDAAPAAAGAEDDSRLQPAEADAEVLVIEHSHAGTRVLGTDRDDTDLHRVLGRHGFKFSRQQEFWYLSRQQRYDTRSWRVRELVADLDRLGRPYLLGEEETEAAAEAAPVPLPDLPPYTDRRELLEDRRQVRAAYHEATTATAAARRMLSLGEGRSDAAALYQAWRAVAHDDNTSGPDDLADRYAQLYRAARALCDNLVAERKRAPVLMGHLADLVTHGERFAARLHATAEAAGVVGQHLTPTVAETVHSDLSAQTTQREVAEPLTLALGGQDTDAPTPAEASSAGPVGMPAVALDEDEFRAASPAEGALAWWDAGCSVVPVRADGSKAPAGESWVQYQTQRATRERVTAWFAGGHPGIGVVCGTVSGDLEMFEFEGRAVDEGLVDRLRDQLTNSGHAYLWQTVISGYVERSPSGGLHVMFRVEGGVDRNTKLAQREARDEELTDDEQVLLRDKGARARRVLIETRGEGGFVVVAPSQGPVHDSGQPWLALTGTPATIPTLTAEQRNTLHLAAHALDQVPPQAPAPEPAPNRARATSGDGVLPGDDFNERAEWAYILPPHGWEVERVQANRTYWRRPGKDRGISAVTGGDRGDHMWVWSTSTELPSDRAMSKFHVYALLEHGGDFSAAARALRTAGYGRPSTTAPTRPRPAAGATRRPRPADPGSTSTTQPSTSDTPAPDGPRLDGQVRPADATDVDSITILYGLASADDAVRYLLARQNWQHLGWADLVTVAEGEDHELHIATTSRTQIREATARLWPVVCHYGLGFAAALDPETLTESGRFGIIVQLPRGETLDRDTTAVVAALDGYHGHPRALPGGLHVAGSVWYRRANQPAADQPNPPGDPVEKSDQATIGASGPDATDIADAEPRTSGPNIDGNATDAPHEDSVALRRPSARALLAGLDPDVVRADTAGRYPTSPRDATIEHLWRDLGLAEHLDLDSDALRVMCDVIIGLRRGHGDDLDARARYEVANGRGLPTATALVALADEFTERCAGTDALGEALRAVGLDAMPEALRTVANRMAVSGEFQVLGGPDGRIRQTSLFDDSPAEPEPEPASPATTRHVPATGGAPAQPSAQTSPDLDARPVTVTLAEALGRAGQGVDLDAARVDAERQIAGELQRLRAPDLAAVAAVAGQAEAEQVRTRVALSEQRERFLTNAVALFGLAGDEHYRADGRVVDPLQADQILAFQARAALHPEDGQPSVLTWRGLRITFRPAPPGPDYAPVVTVVLDALGELDTTAGLSADMLLGGNEHQVREAVEYPVSAQRPARMAAAERLNITHDHARLAGERAAGPDTGAAGAVPVGDPDRDPPHADDKPTLRLPDGRELVHIPDPQATGADHFGLAVEAYLLEEPGRFRLVVGRNAAHVAHHRGDRPWWWAIQRIDGAGKQIGAGIAPRSAMYGTAQTALRAAAARLVPLEHQLPTTPADPAQQAAGPNGRTTAPTTPTPAPAAAGVPAVASFTEDDGVDIRPAVAPAGGEVSTLSPTVLALRTRLAAAGEGWPSRLDAFLLASDPFDAAHELRMITAEAPTEPRVQMIAAMAWRCQHGRVTAVRAQAFADRLAAADPGLASAAAGRDVRDPRTGHVLHQVTVRADIDGRLILVDTATAGPAAPRCAVDPDVWVDPAGVEILAAADASALLTRWQDLSEQARTLGYTVRDRRGVPSALHPGERLMVIGEDSLAGRVEALTGQLQRVQPQPTPPAAPPPGPPAPESAKGDAVAAAPEQPRRATPHRTVVDAITLIPATDPTPVPLDEQLSFARLAGVLQRDEPGRLALTYVLQLVRNPDQDPQALARTVLNVAHRREEATAVADRLDGLAAKLDAAGYTADAPPIPRQLLLISQHVRAALGTGPAPAGPPPAALDRPATPRPAPPAPPPRVATAPAATPPPEEAKPHADPAPLRPAGRPPASLLRAEPPHPATAARAIEWPTIEPEDQRNDDPDPRTRWVALVEQAGRVGYRVNTTFADTCEIDTTNQILMVSAAHGPEQRVLDLERLLSVITTGGEPTHSSPTAPPPSRTATPPATPAPTAVPPAPAARRMVASRPAEPRPLPASVTPIFDDVLRVLGWADRADLLGHDHPRRVASIPAQPQPIPDSATPVFDQLMRELGWTDHIGGDAAEPPLPRPAAPAVPAGAAHPSTTAGRATALLVPTTTATTRPASTTAAFALGRWDTNTTPRGRNCP